MAPHQSKVRTLRMPSGQPSSDQDNPSPERDDGVPQQANAGDGPPVVSRPHGPAHGLRIFLSTREGHPTVRPAITFIYGKYLPRLGADVTLAAPARAEAPGWDQRWSGGRFLPLAVKDSGPIARQAGLARQFFRALKNIDGHHVVVVRDRIFTGLAALAAARARGVPFVYWMSFPYPEDDLLRAAQGNGMGMLRRVLTWLRGHVSGLVLYRFLMPRADHCLVITRQMKRELARRGLPPGRMTPDPMGVDLELAASIPRDQPPHPCYLDHPVLAYLGSLARTRRPDFFLEVLALVRKSHPRAMLAFIGDASEEPDRAWLRGKAEDMGLSEHCLFTGWLPREQAWSHAAWARAGLCAVPDGFVFRTMSPTKAVEFMALGVPVVAANNPDQEGLVNDSGGGLCAAYDPQDFAQAVCRILKDRDKADKMGGLGREHVANTRSYAARALDLARFYNRLAGRSQSTGA